MNVFDNGLKQSDNELQIIEDFDSIEEQSCYFVLRSGAK